MQLVNDRKITEDNNQERYVENDIFNIYTRKRRGKKLLN